MFPSAGGGYTETYLYSFGNCKVEPPYKVHRRSLNDYTNLGISKQDKLILATNGNSASRELYTAPASIAFLTTSPSFLQQITGQLIWKIEYEFSGRKAPGVSMPQPPAVTSNQIQIQSQP